LSERLREVLAIQEPALFPLFDLGVYYADASLRDIIQYEPESFFEGMDYRITLLLSHIDSCVQTHGQSISLL
jgi:hypothetical protein